ncbi:MAG: hypothetical protein II388_03900, partial [Clostridia bacterium]|nr:hypothetical protein [Clostridia bacterium]
MIVKNGGKLYGAFSVTGGYLSVNSLKDINGTLYNEEISHSACCLNEANTGDNQRGIKMRFGVGTTAPTLADYCLAQRAVDGTDINTQIVCKSASIGSGTNGKVIYTFSFQNVTVSAITVKELCLECSPVGAGTTFMVARTLIQPRTIAAGEVVT